MTVAQACDACLARSAVDAGLRKRASFDAVAARTTAAAAGVSTVCRCDAAYPDPLRDLRAPPAVLHLAGPADALATVSRPHCVAVVGARDASPYGTDVARVLGAGLAGAGVVVISGMARGIDAAAHTGALQAGGRTVAVLAAGPERPYPASARALYRRIRAHGAVVSELPPGTPTRRWSFPARNRLIAALAALTVVVEARPGSGALLTAAAAADLGRPLGAVPGHVTSPLAIGPHGLLAAGARLVTSAADVLAILADHGIVTPGASGAKGEGRLRTGASAHRSGCCAAARASAGAVRGSRRRPPGPGGAGTRRPGRRRRAGRAGGARARRTDPARARGKLGGAGRMTDPRRDSLATRVRTALPRPPPTVRAVDRRLGLRWWRGHSG